MCKDAQCELGESGFLSYQCLFISCPAAITLQFVTHTFQEDHDPTIGEGSVCMHVTWCVRLCMFQVFCVCVCCIREIFLIKYASLGLN